MDRTDLISIFYSNYNVRIDYELLDELLFLLNNNCLNYKKDGIGSINEFYEILDKINNKELNTFDIEGGQNRHLALKLMGIKSYEKTNQNTLVENWFNGYKPDVMFKNQSGNLIIVECGDTNPVKITEYFARPEVEKIIIISYPDEGDDLIYQHIFIKNENFNDYLKIKKRVILGKIKKIIKKM